MILDSPVLLSVADREVLHGPAADDLRAHRSRFGDPVDPPVEVLLTDLDDVKLTGHGGGHFGVARKWRTALASTAAGAGAPVVVANAAEGEPLSAKDAAVLALRPHLVLDGLACAAAAVGAEHAVLWLHSTAGVLHDVVGQALADRRALAPDPVGVELLLGPPGYLTGESSAVVRALGGGPAAPAFLRVPSAERGVHGRPTLVHNVETLARVALIARFGAEVTATGHGWGQLLSVLTPAGTAVVEVGADRTLRDAVSEVISVAGPGAPAAVLLGGFGGQWARWDAVAGKPVGNLLGTGLRGLGAGIVAPIAADSCGLRETAAVLSFLAASSAGQCGPCVLGTRELADRMTALAEGRARRRDLERLLGIAALIDGRGACGLPDGAAKLAHSALEVFGPDAEQHARRRPCQGRVALPVPDIDYALQAVE